MENYILVKSDDLKKLIAEAVQSVIDDNKESFKSEQTKQNDLISRRETARLLNVSLPTLHNYVRNGKLNPYQIGRRILFNKEEVIQSLTKLSFKAN